MSPDTCTEDRDLKARDHTGAPTPCKEDSYYCPIAATMDLLNGKWTLHILRELMGGRKRFNELSRALGAVSSKTLCCRLRALEEQGILIREIKNTIPPWVEYELTDKGRALSDVIRTMVAWGETYMQEDVAACRAALATSCE